RSRQPPDAADRQHVGQVVLELEPTADCVLEVGVDRRLEQRRRFEALLDEQAAVADRDVGAEAVGAALRARVAGDREAEQCGHKDSLVTHGRLQDHRKVVYSNDVGSQNETPIWNMMLLMNELSAWACASAAVAFIVGERL